MTNILIPTDFTASSLQLAEQAVLALETKNATIILFHAFELPTSEYELLAPGRSKPWANLVTDNFRQLCKQFKDQNPKAVNKICFKFMEGSSAPLFRNFVDANEIDIIVCPDHFQHVPVHKQSVDPRPLFKKSGIRVLRELGVRKRETGYQEVEMPLQVAMAAN
ncbi:MAG TPA: universal stress protein [Ferruginibacter sp.]|nr:universal stress protein [Ferruginibacter sp.]